MRHDILEISAVPRKQAELRALVAVARQARRRQNLTRFVAANVAAWAAIVLMLHGCNSASPASVAVASYDVFLPVVMQGK